MIDELTLILKNLDKYSGLPIILPDMVLLIRFRDFLYELADLPIPIS